MFAVSVCQSVCHAASIGGGACSIRRVQGAQGHSVQPSPNAFGVCVSAGRYQKYSNNLMFDWLQHYSKSTTNPASGI